MNTSISSSKARMNRFASFLVPNRSKLKDMRRLIPKDFLAGDGPHSLRRSGTFHRQNSYQKKFRDRCAGIARKLPISRINPPSDTSPVLKTFAYLRIAVSADSGTEKH